MTKPKFTYFNVSKLALATTLTMATAAHAQTDTSVTPKSPAPAAQAQPEPQASGLGEIIVTAQRRSESLQKTALTIQVVKAEALAQAGVSSPSQLAALLPTVQISTSGPATSVYFRGVGGFQASAATSPAVPYYLDGIYVARTQSVDSEFYDVDRLEVVKGPQGTLYGRNASGGAINILTIRPNLTDLRAHAELEVGNYGDQTIEAGLNVPLSATVAVRASGTIVDKGGYTSIGLGDDKHQSARLKLLWQPSESFSVLLNGSYGHIGGRGAAIVAVNRDIPGWQPWLDVSDARTQAYSATRGILPPPFTLPSDGRDTMQDLSFYNISGQINWKLSGARLTIVPAYRYSTMQYATLLGFTVKNGYGIGSLPARPVSSKATSIETRLDGEKGPLQWLVGLYYFNDDQQEQYSVNGGLLQSNGIMANYGTKSYAAFSQNSVSLTHSLRLIVGGRYTSDTRETSNGDVYLISPVVILGPPPPAPSPPPPPQAVACLFPAPSQPQCLVDQFAGKHTFRNFSWKLGFEADVLHNSLVYATESHGFKAGGFNSQSAVGHPGQADLYNPEVLTSYEVGLKSKLLNNRLQLNLSGYYWDYNNHQEPVITYTNIPGVTNLVYRNAGDARIYGVTIDVLGRPWQGATINGSLEYAHSRYKSFDYTLPVFAYSPASNGCRVSPNVNPLLVSLNCSGFEVARTPKWAGNVGITQDVPVGTATLSANANLNFADKRWLGVDFIPTERVKSYGKIDASLTLHSPKNRYSITGFVRNITNAVIYGDGQRIPLGLLVYGSIQPPRTYGARLSFDY